MRLPPTVDETLAGKPSVHSLMRMGMTAYMGPLDTARKQLAQHGDPLPQLPPDVRSLQAYVRKLEKQLDDATSMGDVGIPAREDWRRRPETAAGR